MGTTRTYTTLADLTSTEIIPALGDYASDFDIDALTAELRHIDAITYNKPQQGFTLDIDPDTFWSIAARHDTTA